MKGDIKTLSHEPLQLRENLPGGFTGVRLPGGTVIAASGKFGTICIQYFSGAHYSIGYSLLDIVEKFILQCRIKSKGLFTRIVLGNTIKHTINGAKEIKLYEGQF